MAVSSLQRNESYWTATVQDAKRFPSLQDDITVDVAIIGGGMVGLSAAAKLVEKGRTVAVLEALRIGRQVTGRSTAKITSQHNLIYRQLLEDFGRDKAKIYAEANEGAGREIKNLIERHRIDCWFEHKDAFVYAEKEEEVARLRSEAEAAASLGLPASFTKDTGLPFEVSGAVKFSSQAQFNPSKYLAGLAHALEGKSCRIFENTRVREIDFGESCRVHTAHGTVSARSVVMATHMPLGQTGFFYTKAYPYFHPMVACPVDPGRAPAGMYISAGHPVHSLRGVTDEHGQSWLIAVGESFKGGHAHKEKESFDDLASFLRRHFDVQSIEYRWTNEDYNPMDGIPFIGRSPGHDNLFVATGFKAWGITTGMYAGMIIADLVNGLENPWADFFDAGRVRPLRGGKSFARENYETGKHLVKGYVKKRPHDLAGIQPGEARIIKQNGDRVAVFKDDKEYLHAVSAACSHMGCVLGWNGTDRTWDCHCHGSRFSHDGRLLHGPATEDLKPIKLEEALAGEKQMLQATETQEDRPPSRFP